MCVWQSLWEEARNYPLYSLLKKKTDYVFVCINEMAVKVRCVSGSPVGGHLCSTPCLSVCLSVSCLCYLLKLRHTSVLMCCLTGGAPRLQRARSNRLAMYVVRCSLCRDCHNHVGHLSGLHSCVWRKTSMTLLFYLWHILDRQTAACSERCCTDCHWHQEVWSRTVTFTAYWAALAGRLRVGLLQACSDGPPMSPGQGAAVSVELLCASLWSCQSSATAICLSSSASTDPTISSQNIRPLGFCCGWPDVLELTGRWTANFSSDRFKLALMTFLFSTY